MMRKTVFTLILGATSAFALSACGVVDLTPDKPASKNAPAAAPAPAETTAPAPAGPGLRAVQSALGAIVTDNDGRAVYRFDKDGFKPSKPTCYGQCADKWPVYVWQEGLTLDGIDQSLIGKVLRTDGVYQLTIAGWPAYTYAEDEPGQWKGHGVGKTWWVFTPAGKKAPAAPPAASPSKSKGTGSDY
jgi:predicted lipoprotein with Yx(FWY)xxD motif